MSEAKPNPLTMTVPELVALVQELEAKMAAREAQMPQAREDPDEPEGEP